MNEGEVYFSLRGDNLDPDAITRVLGLQPTRLKRKADPLPRTSYWHLSSGRVIDEVVDVYALSSALVARLVPRTEAIRQAIAEHSLVPTLQVVLHIDTNDATSTPAIGFDGVVVSFLASIGATIDIDTYRRVI